jgi:hypothetical protein
MSGGLPAVQVIVPRGHDGPLMMSGGDVYYGLFLMFGKSRIF